MKEMKRMMMAALLAATMTAQAADDNTTRRGEATEGTFTAVALNVDGLPNTVATIKLNEDGPGSEGTKVISQYLAAKGYDLIGCSEDFNYNGSLMEALNGNYSCGTVRKTLSISGLLGGLPFDTDGLNLIWKNERMSVNNESWTRWNQTTSTDGNQYVKKGYRHYDVLIDGTALIDVYILHMDAGDAVASRESQWAQLCDAINAGDLNRPKLVIGDTNSRWTREDITTHFMKRLDSSMMATDVWVKLYRSGVYPKPEMDDLTDQSNPSQYRNYEVVDKIICINPRATDILRLQPMSFRIENDYTYDNVRHDGNTKPLGDHRPVVVKFRYWRPADTEGISTVATDREGSHYTDLSGRRVASHPTRPGIYMKDGQKVVVK